MQGGGGETVEGLAGFAAGEEIAAECVGGAELEIPHAVGPGFHLGLDGLAGSGIGPDRAEAQGEGIIIVLAAQGLGRTGVVDEGHGQAIGKAFLESGSIGNLGQGVGVGQFGVPSAGIVIQGDWRGRGCNRCRRSGLRCLRSFAGDERVQAQGQRGQQGDDSDFFEDSFQVNFHIVTRAICRNELDERGR